MGLKDLNINRALTEINTKLVRFFFPVAFLVTFSHYNNVANPDLTELSSFTAGKQPSLGSRCCEEPHCKPPRGGHSQSEQRAGRLQRREAGRMQQREGRRESCSDWRREGGKAAVIGAGKAGRHGGRGAF